MSTIEARPFTPDGFLRLEQFEGALPERYWNLPDESFARWANVYAEIRREFRTPTLLAHFQKGDQGSLEGKLITNNFGKVGVASRIAPGLSVEEGVPYVVEVLGKDRQNKRRVFDLSVERKATCEDVLCFRETAENVRIEQLLYLDKRGGGAVGRLDDGDKKGKVVMPLKNCKITPKDGEEWVSQIVYEEPQFLLAQPLLPVSAWSLPTVCMDDGIPEVVVDNFEGIRKTLTGVRQEHAFAVGDEVSNRELLGHLMRKLPEAEQAILARLWNIWVTREQQRIREEKTFVQEVRQAQRKAWEAYKEERVMYGLEEPQRVVSTDDRTYTMQPVTIVGGFVQTYDILIDHPQASVEAWRRYNKDLHAVVAAEAYQIATSDEYFISNLRAEEEIDLHLEELQASRPENTRLFVRNLEAIFRHYKGKPSREVARAEFKKQFRVESSEISSDIVAMKLIFAPTLYARHPGSKEKGQERLFSSETYAEPGLDGSDGKVYEVEYTLAAGEVEYRDGFYDLPEHIQARVADMLASGISRFRESVVEASGDGVEKVSWKRAARKRRVEKETGAA